MTTRRVPVTLVGGWYGSGKSTLIRHLASPGSDPDRDATLVVQGGFVSLAECLPSVVATEEHVVELEPSCASCAVRHDLVELLPLYATRRRPPRRIVVELTGSADVVTAAQTLLGDADLRRSNYLDGIVVTVDGTAAASRLVGGHDLFDDDLLVEQVAVADHLVVSGIADLPPRLADAICWSIRGVAPTAALSLERPPAPDQVFDLGAFHPATVEQRLLARSTAPCPSPAEHRGVVSTTVVVDGPLDPDRLERWMDELHHQHGRDVLRLHGVLAVHGEPERWVVSGARTVIDLGFGGEWGDEPRRSILEVVGRHLDTSELSASFSALAHA